MNDQRQETAYLLVTLNTKPPFPSVRRAFISSSPVDHTAINEDGTCHAEITRFSAETFDEAYKGLRKHVLSHAIYSWARIWVEDSVESNAALKLLYKR